MQTLNQFLMMLEQLVFFFQSAQLSPLMRATRDTLLGTFGHREAEYQARQFLNKPASVTEHPIHTFLKPLLLDRLNARKGQWLLHARLSDYQQPGVPFELSVHDPAQVLRIKKMVNALYWGEEAFKIIEGIHLERLRAVTIVSELWCKLQPLIETIYPMTQLLTHLEMDLTQDFLPEFNVLNHVLLKEMAPMLLEHSNYAHQMGNMTGLIAGNLAPLENLNLGTMLYASKDWSRYLNDIAHRVQRNTDSYLKAHYFKRLHMRPLIIPKEKTMELDNAAYDLEEILQNILSNGEIQWWNAYLLLYRIDYIKSVLIHSIFLEAESVKYESEKFLKALLAQIKYVYLLETVTLLDRLEEASLVSYGLWTDPFLKYANRYYEVIVKLCRPYLESNESSGKDLFYLLDSEFLNRRKKALYERYRLDERKSIEAVFLRAQLGLCFGHIPEQDPVVWWEHFKWIQSYVQVEDPALFNKIVACERPEAIDLSAIVCSGATVHDKLLTKWNRQITTQSFTFQLKQNQCHHFYETFYQTQHIHPYDLEAVFDELPVFEISTYSGLLDALSMLQIQSMIVMDIQASSTQYFQHLRDNIQDENDQHALYRHYLKIQPAWMTWLRTKDSPVADANVFERKILQYFRGFNEHFTYDDRLEMLSFQADFEQYLDQYHGRVVEEYHAISQLLQRQTCHDPIRAIQSEEAMRVGFVVKNPIYLSKIKSIEKDVKQCITEYCSPFIYAACGPEGATLPFPNLERQVMTSDSGLMPMIAIQQLYNALYYLKKACEGMETLNDRDYKIQYVWHVIEIEENIRKSMMLFVSLSKNPYLKVLHHVLQARLDDVQPILQSWHVKYDPVPLCFKDKPLSKDLPFYMMHALLITREEIVACHHHDILSAEQSHQIQNIAHQFSNDMHRLFREDAHWKSMIKIPLFFTLFNTIKTAWREFSTEASSALEGYLEQLYSKLFAKILIACDDFEVTLALKPVISKPFKKILEAYYQGLLQVLAPNLRLHIAFVTSSTLDEHRLRYFETRLRMCENEPLHQGQIQEKIVSITLEKDDQAQRVLLKQKILKSAIQNRHVVHYRGLYDAAIRELYAQGLSDAIRDQQDRFINERLDETIDIEPQIDAFLKDITEDVDKKSFILLKMYQDVNKLLIELRMYLDAQQSLLEAHPGTTWSFETEDTIAVKNVLYKELEQTLHPNEGQDDAWSDLKKGELSYAEHVYAIQRRFDRMKEILAKKRFQNNLVARASTSSFPFFLWLTKLLQALGLCRPSPTEHIKNRLLFHVSISDHDPVAVEDMTASFDDRDLRRGQGFP